MSRDAHAASPTVDLYRIPQLIKGGWQLAGGHGPIDQAQALADMRTFVDAGVTTFDCADIYTGVEQLIGDFLRTVPPAERLRLRVHTKFVPDLSTLATLEFADVERAIDRSRARLGVDRLDLVQVHWWDYRVHGYVEAAQHLGALQRSGKIRHVGATNFGVTQLGQVLGSGVHIVTHQVQYSVLDRRPADQMAALCAVHGIHLLCYGSLAGGFLSERWLGAEEPVEPLENRSLTKYKLIIDEFGGWALFQSLLRVLARIAADREASIGTVALRWTLDQPQVSSVIVGARNARHLGSTIAAQSVRLSESDHARIDAVLARSSGPAGDVYALERDRDGRHGRIMRYDLGGERG